MATLRLLLKGNEVGVRGGRGQGSSGASYTFWLPTNAKRTAIGTRCHELAKNGLLSCENEHGPTSATD